MFLFDARTLLVFLTVSAAALAGCLGGQDDETNAGLDGSAASLEETTSGTTDADDTIPLAVEVPEGAIPVRIPVGAFDPNADLQWYEIANTDVPSGATLFIINEDTAYHRVLGFLDPTPVPAAPEWTTMMGHHDNHTGDDHHEDGDHHGNETTGHDDHGDETAGHDDGHGGHDHGGNSTLFDVELQAGEATTVTVEGDGALTIHCHPHPWMESHWTLRPAETEYPLVAHRVVLNGTSAGGLALGHDAEDRVEIPLNVTAPNLSTLFAEVTWDDSANDGPGGAEFNSPDTLTLQLVSPQGWVVAETTETARQGRINATFHDATMRPPTSLVAAGLEAAGLALHDLGGDAWTGTWLLRVTLDAAPGYVDDGGEFHDAPSEAGFDGGQDFDLTVQGVHEYATLEGEPTTTYMEYHLEGAEHEH